MKKIFSFFVALMATMMLFAQDAYKVTWVTNGVEMPTAPTSNEDLWTAFKPAFNAYYGLARADQPIDKVSTFATKMQDFMTKDDSDWKWLGDYVSATATAQVNPTTGANYVLEGESPWRWQVHAFFNASAQNTLAVANADFTEAGKIENWLVAWKETHWLPETMTAFDPMPVLEREGYTFLGWYDNEACIGEPVNSVTKAMTLYAKWEKTTYEVVFVAPFAYPNDMYVDDVYELAYALQKDYNAAYNTSKAWAKMENGQVYFNISGDWKTPVEAKGQDGAVAGFIQNSTWNTSENLKNLVEKEGSKWTWMQTVILVQRVASNLTDPMSDALYCKEIASMFLASPHSTTAYAENADWSKFDADSIAKAWGGIVSLPDTIAEDYTLPVMYRENYEFKGWFWNEDFSGEEVKVVPVKSNGTLYAKLDPTDKALLGVALSKTGTVELQMPNTDQLTVIFTPETAANKNVTWSSSDENILVVDQNGLVTPKAPGKAMVKVVSDESKLVASVEYNISAAAGAVTGVTLDQKEVTLEMGKTLQLVATIAPEDAVNKKITWASNSKAASVDENGLVKADTVGTATITVTTEDGGYTATCAVTVPEPLDNIKVEKVWELTIPTDVANIGDVRCGMGWNGKFYLTDKNQNKVRVFTKDGEDVDAAIPMTEGAKLGTGIAIDDAGNILLAANFPGNDTCVFIIKNGETAMKKVNFHLPIEGRADMFTAFGDIFSEQGGLAFFHGAGANKVQYVKIANGALVETKQLDGIVKAGSSTSQVLYGTENEAWLNVRGQVMQYVKDGVVTDIAPKNVVTNDCGGAAMLIGGNNVWAYKVGTVHSSEFSIRNMTTEQFVGDKDGNTVQYIIDTKAVTNNTYSNFTKAEKINDYAYYLNVFTSGKGAAVYKVYKNVPVESITLDTAAAELNVGDKLQLNATITPAYATVQDVEWTTSNADVATVTETGLVQAISAGEATITVTSKDGSFTATCTITVKAVRYKKATSLTQLVAGKKMLIVNADENRTLGQATKNNFSETEIAPENHRLAVIPADATIITLMQEGDLYTFAVDGGYITATTATKSNYLRVADEQSTLTQWNVTIGENGVATIVCPDEKAGRNTIRYNESSKLFAAYQAENTQKDVVIYIEYDPEAEVTYNVTVPEGTPMCYIVGAMTDSWNTFVPMDMVDATHYTITLDNAAKTDEYKYTCAPDWKYVEKNADGSERGNRTWAEQDVVEAWAALPEGVEDIRCNADSIEKVLLNGQLYIIRGGNIYNANGAVVR